MISAPAVASEEFVESSFPFPPRTVVEMSPTSKDSIEEGKALLLHDRHPSDSGVSVSVCSSSSGSCSRIAVAASSKTALFFKALRYGPITLFYCWSLIATFVSLQPLLLKATCRRHLQLSESICDVLTSGNFSAKKSYRVEETALQVQIANLMFWRSVVTYAFPLLLVLSIGSWSDRHGRRLPILIFLLSVLSQNVVLIACAQLPDSPLTGPWTIALGSCLLTALVGGEPSFMMTFFGHIADTSTPEERTFLNGAAMSFLFAGIALGYNVGGFLASGILTPTEHFALLLAMQLAVTIYTAYVLKEDKKPHNQEHKLEGFGQTIASFVDFSLIRDTLQTTFKRRSGGLRATLAWLVLAHVCGQAPWMGELSVVYIFGKYKFGWSTAEYGTFTSSRYVMGFLGNWFVGTLLDKTFGMGDRWIGIFTCISSFVAYIVFVLAPTIPWMYVGAVFTFGISTMQVIPRCIMSKLVPTTEIGSVTAFLAVFDCLIGISAAPFYSQLYAVTLDSFTSAFFVVSAGFMLPGVAVYVYLIRKGSSIL